MKLEPEIAAYIAATVVDRSVAKHEITLEELRAEYRSSVLACRHPRPQGIEVFDDFVEHEGFGIPVRHYQPSGGEDLPCLLFFHGGGWVMGDLDTHDDIAHK